MKALALIAVFALFAGGAAYIGNDNPDHSNQQMCEAG